MIGIGFYDYEACIVERLRALGAHVDAFLDRPAGLRSGPIAALSRRWRLRMRTLVRRHERRILAQVSGSAYDQVLVIKGIDLRPEFIAALRGALPAAEFILYEWDAWARLEGIEARLSYFDRVLTFDRLDAARHSFITFRPLFFREGVDATFASTEAAAPIGLSFVGWLHSDRLDALERIQAEARGFGVTTFVYLYTGLFTWLKLALRGRAKNVHWRPLPYRKLMSVNRRSNAILDLPHKDQSGMTMRAIEAVGLGKNLITTARDAVHYDFYASGGVRVMDGAFGLDDAALCLGSQLPAPADVRRRYSLDGWLADVFDPRSMRLADAGR